jgi:predicted CoA-binding protein
VNPSDREIRQILETAKTIAVVGLSDNPERESHRVARYLQSTGYRIIPVNPMVREVLGEKSYESLAEIPEPVDVVDVFRKPEAVVPIAREAIDIGAGTLWLQQGIVNQEAADLAEAAGLQVVMDRCMMVEHRRLV